MESSQSLEDKEDLLHNKNKRMTSNGINENEQATLKKKENFKENEKEKNEIEEKLNDNIYGEEDEKEKEEKLKNEIKEREEDIFDKMLNKILINMNIQFTNICLRISCIEFNGDFYNIPTLLLRVSDIDISKIDSAKSTIQNIANQTKEAQESIKQEKNQRNEKPEKKERNERNERNDSNIKTKVDQKNEAENNNSKLKSNSKSLKNFIRLITIGKICVFMMKTPTLHIPTQNNKQSIFDEKAINRKMEFPFT